MPGKLTEEQTAQCLSAIAAAFPELHGASFTVLTHSWDSIAIAAGGLIFKFPQSETAAASLRREAGLLRLIRPRLSVPVPDMTLFEGQPLFSAHRTLPGDHLPPAAYAALPEAAKARLGATLGTFYARLHSVPTDLTLAAGALPARAWADTDVLLEKAVPAIPEALRDSARDIIRHYAALGPDPHGQTCGYFDGHGWNMAFDFTRNRLAGLYDFADAGIGPVHREFVYPAFIARDLVLRIIDVYSAETGRRPDQRRIDILTAALRLSELAAATENPATIDDMRRNATEWLELMAQPL